MHLLGGLLVWVQPDPSISPVATVPAGDAVEVVDEVADGWARVRWGVGQEGWVDGRQLVVSSAADVGAGAPHQPGRGGWVVAVVVALAGAGAVVGCAVTQGDDDSAVVATQASQPGTGVEVLTVEAVASSLEFFGDLAVVRSEPVTTAFDSSARLLELEDGAMVDVPAGAFDDPTNVSIVIVDLDFEQYAENPPRGTAYVLSTEAAVALGEPLVLEVPAPADAVRVMQSIDGQWRLVDVPDGPTTRISITHFSEVPTVVVQPGIGDPVLIGDDPGGDTPGDFLISCVFVMSAILSADYDDADPLADNLADNLALSFCTRALVTKHSPSGVRVEVSCVGAKIGGDVDLLAAIDACIAENEPADTSAPPDETEEGVTGEEPATPAEPDTDSGYRVEASMVPAPGEAEFEWVGSFVVGEDGGVAGTGQGSGFSESACSIDDGDRVPYSFSVTWSFDISGTADESVIDLILSPGGATITPGPATDESFFCVSLAKDIVRDVAGFPLGGDDGLGIINVPKDGGTTTLGTEPFLVEVTVTAAQP
jgi:hypothetical protein